MKSNSEIKNIAINTLLKESEAISNLAERIDDEFIGVVKVILNISGRVIVAGIGKSAIIAQKIVATLNSTGTPSSFMHAADAIHGDLGMIQPDDLVMVLSKSGDTAEIKVLVTLLKQSSHLLVALVGNRQSFLAKHANYILDASVAIEACPFNLAPTSSTTAQLAMGDALAMCLLECRSFNDQDFARYHPGGILGKQLFLTAGDLALSNEIPFISPTATIKEVIITITRHRLGAVAVIEDDKIRGIVTDGDIRRMLENHTDFSNLHAANIMGTSPKTIDRRALAVQALELIRSNNITQLLVTDEGRFFGILHLHDLLKEGII
ncbi:arabinose-5-phosphate isomerase [bacterium A37T11]|nr:arabinose-5-phosphate isomerase [bacterium A37T11]